MTALLLLFFLGIFTFGQYGNKKPASTQVEQTQIKKNFSGDYFLAPEGGRTVVMAFDWAASLDWNFYEVLIDFPGLRVAQHKHLFTRDITLNTFYTFTCINAP